MQIHQLQPSHASKRQKRVGRGGKKGTYSGKGGKGQTARAGRKLAPIIRELIKRYPKLKGYRASHVENHSMPVNLEVLEKHTANGDVVTPEFLANKGIIRFVKGKALSVKILGTGTLTKKITVERCKVSASAKAAVEKAGGSVK